MVTMRPPTPIYAMPERSVTPAIRRVPAWTVAVSEHSHPDWVYVASDPETGRAIVGYDETVRRFPTDPPPVRCVHRLAAIEIAIVPEETP